MDKTSQSFVGFEFIGKHIMETGANFIRSGRYKKIILVGADKMSSMVDYTERATCPIFGDGAAAVMMEPTTEDVGVMDATVSYTHLDVYKRQLTGHAEDSRETAVVRCEEGGDDVKSARPLRCLLYTSSAGRSRLHKISDRKKIESRIHFSFLYFSFHIGYYHLVLLKGRVCMMLIVSPILHSFFSS